MSLINKMLQDLDARGSQSGAALAGEIRPVLRDERRLPVMQIVLGASVLVIAMALAAYFWLKGRAPAPAAAPPVLSAAPTVVLAAPPAPPLSAPAPAPAAVSAKPLPVAPADSRPVSAAAPPLPAAAAPAPRPQPAAAAIERATVQAAAPETVRAVEGQRTVALAAPRSGGREMTPAQRAESQYRQAMAAADEGRVASAMDGLEQVLALNPRHDAARQGLVALLIESGRQDEAMRQLEQGLAADVAQPALAMLLARMQIERGVSGVATLQRTLPAAQGNADYHAFLAGALQRENRHREAAEQYRAALRKSPEHGVWLMGLGISLQADKRDADALAAFQKAKSSGMLTPALMSFVQGRIAQLQ